MTLSTAAACSNQLSFDIPTLAFDGNHAEYSAGSNAPDLRNPFPRNLFPPPRATFTRRVKAATEQPVWP